MFGLDEQGVEAAARISAVLGAEWRGLLAGADGFSTAEEALWEQRVLWGEMVRP